MSEVLVLGNGISRLGKDEVVNSWPGEVWGCNRAFEEFPSKLTRITGHDNVLEEAAAYRVPRPEASYEIWAGHLGRISGAFHPFTCPPQFRNDSGTTLVAQALEEGKSVAAFGFDLGGYDIHSPGLEKHDKSAWVKRWREIIAYYGAKRIRFIGYDHMPFLLSGEPTSKYAADYLVGAPHIDSPEYRAAWEKHTGRSAKSAPRGSVMVKVKFPNGYESMMREIIAVALSKKGECVIVDESATSLKPESSGPAPERKKGKKK